MALTIKTVSSGGMSYDIDDAEGIKWSSHYGETGGGFGYLKFTLRRRLGFDYQDIGFNYRATIYKNPEFVLFDGLIKQIEESSSEEEQIINVTAYGWNIVFQDGELLRAFCDKRLNRWSPESEIPASNFRPDLFKTGSNALGIYLSANNKTANANQFTKLEYNFFEGETAERIKTDLSIVLGAGVNWDGRVSSIDTGNSYVFWKDAINEDYIESGMMLSNANQAATILITAVDKGLNRFTVQGSITNWKADDELVVYGPRFSAEITSISNDTIDYTNQIGETLVVGGDRLVNTTKSAVAVVSSIVTASDQIVVTDANHITGWSINDKIMVTSPFFHSEVQSVASDVITYGGTTTGVRLSSSATGWVLYNVTQDDFATVQSWNTGSSQITVTAAGDISGWVLNDVIEIYSGFSVEIQDSNDVVLWPSTEWREGAINRTFLAINETTSGSPTGLKIIFKTYLGGLGDQTNFVQASNVRAYSTTSDITAETLADFLISKLSALEFGLSSDDLQIASISNIIEPMVYEFVTPNDAISQACSFGDGSGNLLAWGVELNDLKRMYLEVQDTSQISYVVERENASLSVSADLTQSVQRVRGSYTDKLGNRALSTWQEDATVKFDGRHRERTVSLSNIDTLAGADAVILIYLNDNKLPKKSSNYSVTGSIYTPEGVPVPFDEIQATGKSILLQDFRGNETGVSDSNLGQGWIQEQLVGVEVDYESRSVNLIPASATDTFGKFMANIARMLSR